MWFHKDYIDVFYTISMSKHVLDVCAVRKKRFSLDNTIINYHASVKVADFISTTKKKKALSFSSMISIQICCPEGSSQWVITFSLHFLSFYFEKFIFMCSSLIHIISLVGCVNQSQIFIFAHLYDVINHLWKSSEMIIINPTC